MLEQFETPESMAIRVDEAAMRAAVEAVFRGIGLGDEDAAQSADVLLYADLRGYDTHGVSNMLRIYVEWARTGQIDINASPIVLRERRATCTLDAQRTHGGIVGPHAMRLAIERAKDIGVGVVNVLDGGHYGAAAYTAAMALEHGMIGISMTLGGLRMVPTHGAEELVGLNPIAIAVPARREEPFIFDASMSAIAGNKVRLADRLGRGTLPGWITEADGTPIMEEAPIPEGFMHLPVGGTRAIGSHKGYGLAMMIEVLAGTLSGGAAGPDRRARQSQQFVCYDIDAFTDPDVFLDDMDRYLSQIRSSRPEPGAERVLYPGLHAAEVERERRTHGIPYHPEVLTWFAETFLDLGVDNPLPVPDGTAG